MLIFAETIQKLADREAAKQRQAELVLRYRNAGDEETAQFLDLPAEQQQQLLVRQDFADLNAAVNAGDRAAAEAALSSAIARQRRGTKLTPRQKVRR